MNDPSSCGVGFVCDLGGRRSRETVSRGIEALKNLTHRGAVGGDGKTGDGAGICIQIPARFFLRQTAGARIKLSGPDKLAVGVFFLTKELERELEPFFEKRGFRIAGWRDVPVDDSALGQSALVRKPLIRQLILDTDRVNSARTEAELFLARRAIERAFSDGVYIPSLSSKIIVYKGMIVATQIEAFYPDLADPEIESAFCVFHQRFSTNTFPDWTMAQPLRTLAHNGEINTLRGNRNWMSSIQHDITHEVFGKENELLKPLVSENESDSASLDRIVELLMLSGYAPEHAVNMCIPPAWENSELEEKVTSFFEFQSLLMKPWDGPAAVVFTDGTTVGAHLDRNGLRPLRYSVTYDGFLVLGSETGMLDLDAATISERGRLGPGETLSVRPGTKRIRLTDEVLNDLAARRPYSEWTRNIVRLSAGHTIREGPGRQFHNAIPEEIVRRQVAFGYTSDELDPVIREMAVNGRELTFSMGDDTPLPSLSRRPQLLFRYFRQRFAQVTNPPIDPIREKTVMSLRMALGHKMNFLYESAGHARRLHLDSPILLQEDIEAIENQTVFRTERIQTTYRVRTGDPTRAPGAASELAAALEDLRKTVIDRVEKGAVLLILSDSDLSSEKAAVPSLLAVSASFRALRGKGLVNRASLLIETGEARDVHHMACLIGFGASAIYPYLALQTISEMCARGELDLPFASAARNYKRALDAGLLKVLSRMGISTLNSYYAAGMFDTVCLNKDFVESFFPGAAATIEADGPEQIENSLMERHSEAFRTASPAPDFGGILRHRKDTGEFHQWSISAVVAFGKFIRSGSYDLYRTFLAEISRRPLFLRHLIEYKRGAALPVEEVEPEEDILRRFFSGAMSVGALSPEAHETIAEGCNTLGIRSNSGEGGEDPLRYWTLKNSAIKQVASGRFGVTPAYLASASEIEIKMAQGAKPGEGGHLPAAKVTEYIARLRHCSPGTLLISPPPHHDIYSIEDLAQLINDLKNANPKAKICVKLVAEAGIGAVAAGVAKCYADIIQICGCEGGTGASPIGSIKNAGGYWEPALAEAQRALIENNLRGRVRLRVDGGFCSGADVVTAALLGAEEYGFGTASMLAVGCIMARQCHLNTCPTGVATQDEKLRRKFKGKAEGIALYFRAVAREVREILAGMGFRKMEELIGRSDLITKKNIPDFPEAERTRLGPVGQGYSPVAQRKSEVERNDNPSPSLNDRIVNDIAPYLERAERIERFYPLRNVDRSVPLKLNYEIAIKYGDGGLPADTIGLIFRGTAGQSFGAFNHKGVSLTLIGEANDYVAKGMFGGRVVIRPENVAGPRGVIIGNTALYGATGGEFYCSGRAGERFAVRNSGATAVVEGAGHHLCEYMTRGIVVVLGNVGYNIGAGMTGGIIYIHDPDGQVLSRLDSAYVTSSGVEDELDIQELKTLVEELYRSTESPTAEALLSDFRASLGYFRKITAL